MAGMNEVVVRARTTWTGIDVHKGMVKIDPCSSVLPLLYAEVRVEGIGVTRMNADVHG